MYTEWVFQGTGRSRQKIGEYGRLHGMPTRSLISSVFVSLLSILRPDTSHIRYIHLYPSFHELQKIGENGQSHVLSLFSYFAEHYVFLR